MLRAEIKNCEHKLRAEIKISARVDGSSLVGSDAVGVRATQVLLQQAQSYDGSRKARALFQLLIYYHNTWRYTLLTMNVSLPGMRTVMLSQPLVLLSAV